MAKAKNIRFITLLVMISCLLFVSEMDALSYLPRCVRPYYDRCKEFSPPSIWLHVDALYWGAFEDGLKVGQSSKEITEILPGTVSVTTSKAKNLHFDWYPGFRVGIGQGLNGRGGWGEVISWTHLYTRAKRHLPNEFDAKWQIHFDMIDALAGLEIWLTPEICLEITGGLRGVQIRQHFNSFTVNQVTDTLGAISTVEVFRNADTKFWGLGPELGFEGEWNVGCCGFSVFGYAGISMLYGHFNISRHNDLETLTFEDTRNVRKSIQACQLTADAAAGVRWNHVWNGCFNVELDLAFEHHQFFRQNRITCCGDLSLDGLVASIKFGF